MAPPEYAHAPLFRAKPGRHMRTPLALLPLIEYGIVEEVLRPLMSGKEAQIYLVLAGGEQRVAKIYKEAQQRSFKHRTQYTEGRKTRNSRDRRAMNKRSRHGKSQDEAAWRSAEVNAIYRLQAAGVRVPIPYHFIDGVLVMELVKGADGQPAPRLGDMHFDPADAQAIFDHLIREVIRMLCAGIIHGDLSDFNVLMGADGPVIIDFPQAVDPASNQSARKLLLRDVDNLHNFLGRFVHGRRAPFAQEMWDLYQQNLLTPETQLTGRHARSSRPVNTREMLALIGEVNRDEQRRRETVSPKQRGRTSRRGSSRPIVQADKPSADAPRGPRGPKVEVVINPPTASRQRTTRTRSRNGEPDTQRRGSGQRKQTNASSRRRPPTANPKHGSSAQSQQSQHSQHSQHSQPAAKRQQTPPQERPAVSDPAGGPRRKRRRRRRKPRGDAPKHSESS